MEQKFAGLGIYTTAGQAAVLLATALNELRHGPTRQECIAFIESKKWLDIHQADLKPYPSSTEPRWHTLLSWAREGLASAKLIDRQIRDCWQITKDGINATILTRKAFSEQNLDVRKCYMWSSSFKSLLAPHYHKSAEDQPRPTFVYEDELNERKSVRGKKSEVLWEDLTPKQQEERIKDIL